MKGFSNFIERIHISQFNNNNISVFAFWYGNPINIARTPSIKILLFWKNPYPLKSQGEVSLSCWWQDKEMQRCISLQICQYWNYMLFLGEKWGTRREERRREREREKIMVSIMATYVCLHQHVQVNRWRTHSTRPIMVLIVAHAKGGPRLRVCARKNPKFPPP